MVKIFKKALISVLITVLGISVAQAAYPDRPITLIVPWSAGGGSDTSMRMLAEQLSKDMPVPVIVVNKTGAGGAMGTKAMCDAKPDGYTIGMVGSGVTGRQYSNPNANVLSDFTNIAFFGPEPAFLSAGAPTGIKTLEQFFDYAKANPGKIRNGNDNPGGFSHVAASVLEAKFGIKLTKVPYKGYAPTVVGLLAGEVDTVTVPVPNVIDQHKSGKLTILGVADNQRHFMAPYVPTFKEMGYDFVLGSFRTIIGPNGISADKLKYLEKKIIAAVSNPQFQKKARNAGFNPQPMGAVETAKYIKEFDEMLYPVLLSAGLVKVRHK